MPICLHIPAFVLQWQSDVLKLESLKYFPGLTESLLSWILITWLGRLNMLG